MSNTVVMCCIVMTFNEEFFNRGRGREGERERGREGGGEREGETHRKHCCSRL